MPRKVASFVRFNNAYYVLADDKQKINPKHREKLQRYLRFKKKMEDEAVADIKAVTDALDTASGYLSKVLPKKLEDIPDLPTLSGKRINPLDELKDVIADLGRNKARLQELRGSLYALVNNQVLVDDDVKDQFAKALNWVISS